jgi:hypothetical protein
VAFGLCTEFVSKEVKEILDYDTEQSKSATRGEEPAEVRSQSC